MLGPERSCASLGACGASVPPIPGDWLSGRAPRSHRGGHWFDPSIAHQVRAYSAPRRDPRWTLSRDCPRTSTCGARYGPHGDVKTSKSRRSLALRAMAVAALTEHQERQARGRLRAGELWQEQGLVFTTALGTRLDAGNVRRSLRAICRNAGIGENWTPRELRHTFVSLLSDNGMAIEEISRLVGHGSTLVTQTVYRHELRPVVTSGAEMMDRIFADGAK